MSPAVPPADGPSPLRWFTAGLFAAIWLVVVAGIVLPSLPVKQVGAVLLAALIAVALTKASRHIRLLGCVLGGATVVLSVLHRDAGSLWKGLETALPFAAFLPTVVMLRGAVEASPTVTTIRTRLTELDPDGRTVWMTLGAHLLAAIITLGFVSVLRPMLPERLSDTERVTLAQSSIRGLGLAITWSPFFVASAVASQLLPMVAAWRMIGFGLLLACAGMAIAVLMFTPRIRAASLRKAVQRVGVLLLPTAAMVGVVVVVSAATGWTSLQTIVVAFPVASAGYILLRTGRGGSAALKRVATGVGRMGDEVVIMTASAVFGSMVAGYGLPDGMVDLIEGLARFPAIIILLEVAITVGLGMVGLHPMVSAAVLIPLTLSLQIPIAPQVLAQMVMLAWSLSSTIAIWTLPVVVASTTFDVPVRSLATGPNLRFVVVFGLVGCGLLALLNEALPTR